MSFFRNSIVALFAVTFYASATRAQSINLQTQVHSQLPVANETAVGSVGSIQTAGTNGAMTTDLMATINRDGDHRAIFLGPRVDVTNSQFATGTGLASPYQGTNCVGVNGNASGLADTTATYDSTCAVQNAVIYVQHVLFGGMYPVLYFPRGNFHVGSNNAGLVGIIDATLPITIQGDERGASQITNMSTTAPLVEIVGGAAVGSSILNITLSGNGASSNGDLVDVLNSPTFTMLHSRLANSGGVGINLQASERARLIDVNQGGVRQPLKSSGNANEDYYAFSDLTFNGITNGWNFGVNANPYTGVNQDVACTTTSGVPAWSSTSTYASGTTTSFSGVTYNSISGSNTGNTPQFISKYWQACGQILRPDNRSNVVESGANWFFGYSSIKGTPLGGITVSRDDGHATHVYFEANLGSARSFAHSVQEVGKMEVGHLMAAVSASALSFPIDDAGWQDEYTTDPANIALLSTDEALGIFPADFSYGSTAPSVAVPGLLKGQYELVSPEGFSAAGQTAGYPASGSAYVYTRAINGTVAPGAAPGPINTGFAYPAPSLVNGVLTYAAAITRIPSGGVSPAVLDGLHEDMIHPSSGTDIGVCSDTKILPYGTQWVGSPSQACAENFIGAVPDGFSVAMNTALSAAQAPVSPGATAVLRDLDIANGSPIEGGQGWTKIAADGTVSVDEHQVPPSSFYTPNIATLYSGTGNGTTTAYTLSATATSYAVYVAGAAQPSANYAISGTTLTFATAPASGAAISVYASALPWNIPTLQYNSLVDVALTQYDPTHSAQGTILDNDTGFKMNNQGSPIGAFNYFAGLVRAGGGGTALVQQTIAGNGLDCHYTNSYGDTATPLWRTCWGASSANLYSQFYNTSTNAWVTAPHSTTHLMVEAAPSTITGNWTLPAVGASGGLPSGTPPGSGVYSSLCNGSTGVNIQGANYWAWTSPPNGFFEARLSTGWPLGVVYGFTQFSSGTDATYGQTSYGIATWACNTTSSAITLSLSAASFGLSSIQ